MCAGARAHTAAGLCGRRHPTHRDRQPAAAQRWGRARGSGRGGTGRVRAQQPWGTGQQHAAFQRPLRMTFYCASQRSLSGAPCVPSAHHRLASRLIIHTNLPLMANSGQPKRGGNRRHPQGVPSGAGGAGRSTQSRAAGRDHRRDRSRGERALGSYQCSQTETSQGALLGHVRRAREWEKAAGAWRGAAQLAGLPRPKGAAAAGPATSCLPDAFLPGAPCRVFALLDAHTAIRYKGTSDPAIVKASPQHPPPQHPQVHEAMVEAGAYPSPLNYYNFPKSVCTSINEVRGWGLWDCVFAAYGAARRSSSRCNCGART
jgi:hypothetical protein